MLAEATPQPRRVLVLGLLGAAGVVVWCLTPGHLTPWALPAALLLAVAGALLTVVDVREHRLPDVVTLPLYPATLALLGAASLGSRDLDAFLRALTGGLVVGLLLAGVVLLLPAALGLGDAKLAGTLATFLAWVGWPALLAGLYAAFVLGGLVALALLVTRRATRRTALPFGPFLLAGAAAGTVVTTL